ncbi:glucose transporter [Aureococcus anophagefferens]|uniref:Glucose transporter n=1 Tax=Aureococcus anophagefferens TaxID=44056 RepID=A0ABR1FN76_AURAN
MVGAALGSLLVLRYETDWGRVKEMRLASALYGAGALVEGLSGSPGLSAPLGLTVLLFGRVVYGVGIGLAMHGAPTYIAETAPPSIRGALVSAKEAIIVLGLTVGYARRAGAMHGVGRWRYIYWVAMVFAAAMAYGLSGVPARAFERLAGHVRALKADEVGPQSIPEIVENLTSTPASAYGLRAGHGQPSVLYYVTEIFEDYDLGVGASIGLSAWKLVATMLTVRLIDTYGRVPLLQRGSAIMIASMGSLAVAALFLDMASGALAWTSIVTLSLYVGGYQVG